MELKQLRYFQKVAKLSSITMAAEELYISQPAMSRCIKRLEEEVGTDLFERTMTGVQLTEAGIALLIEVDQMFEHLSSGLNQARILAKRDQPRLNLVYSFEEFNTELFAQFHFDFPDVQTNIDILPPDQAYRELLSGKADFAIIPRVGEQAGIVYEQLLSEEMLLAAAAEHPFYGRQFVSLEEMDGQTCVCNEVVYDWDSIQKTCSRHQIDLKLTLSSNDHQTAGRFRNLLTSMMFVPISATMKRDESDTRKLQYPSRIVPQVFRRNIYLAYHAGKRFTTAEKHFLELLRGYYKKLHADIQAFSVSQFG